MNKTLEKDSRVSPIGMWRWGKEFIESALKLQPPPNSELEELKLNFSIPPYYLLAHGIELQLKAYLLSKGYTVKQLRSFNEYGHNLEKLLKESKINNINELVNLSEQEESTIHLLNETYKEKELEYFISGYSSYPKYSILCNVANKISSGISECIRKTV